jgi:hypothetical protein
MEKDDGQKSRVAWPRRSFRSARCRVRINVVVRMKRRSWSSPPVDVNSEIGETAVVLGAKVAGWLWHQAVLRKCIPNLEGHSRTVPS